MNINKKIINSGRYEAAGPGIEEEFSSVVLADQTALENKERDQYLLDLFFYKPWLKECVPNLKTSKLDFIRKNYPLT